MKTSKIQQDQTRRQIVRAAVDLIAQQGYEATSMKQIARAAGIGDATIYKYFPTKEKLLFAYFDTVVSDTLQQCAQTPDLDQFTLQERLQLLVDDLLERMLGDREFVAIARDLIGKSPILMMRDDVPAQAALKEQIVAWLEESEGNGEIAPCDFRNLLGGLFGDYLLAVLVYWLNDESEEFSDTTQLVELTLAVLVLALKSGIVNKLSELTGFLVRNQLARVMRNGSGLLDMLKLARNHLGAHRSGTAG